MLWIFTCDFLSRTGFEIWRHVLQAWKGMACKTHPIYLDKNPPLNLWWCLDNQGQHQNVKWIGLHTTSFFNEFLYCNVQLPFFVGKRWHRLASHELSGVESPNNQVPPVGFIIGSSQRAPLWAVDGAILPSKGSCCLGFTWVRWVVLPLSPSMVTF